MQETQTPQEQVHTPNQLQELGMRLDEAYAEGNMAAIRAAHQAIQAAYQEQGRQETVVQQLPPQQAPAPRQFTSTKGQRMHMTSGSVSHSGGLNRGQNVYTVAPRG